MREAAKCVIRTKGAEKLQEEVSNQWQANAPMSHKEATQL